MMTDLEIMRLEMSGTQCKIVASGLITLAGGCQDTPSLGARFAEMAQMVFKAHKAIEALAGEVKRLTPHPQAPTNGRTD